MRKILMGTTAVVGAALLAPTGASAQEAPTVRIGGYIQTYYGHTIQSNANTIGVVNNSPAAPGTSSSFLSQPSNISVSNTPQGSAPTSGTGSVKTGKNDLSTDVEIHVFVNGKAANGLAYGAVVEIAFDANEGTTTGSARRAFTHKTMAYMDEAYIFLASPTLGQIRFGDEDGVMGGLMNAGIVTNFGTGGVYGYWENFTIRPNRTTTGPGQWGDNTKVIYLSPQFFGFDAGISYAANSGIGQDTGCVQASGAGLGCDRTYAVTGATASGVQSLDGQPQRRNEVQMMARWRGDIAGIGIASSFGYTSWASINDMTASGFQAKTLRPGQVWQAGLQASAYGFTIGGNYEWGQENFFHGSQVRTEQGAQQYVLGASYTVGAFTVGANMFAGSFSGTSGTSFNTTTGVLSNRNAAVPSPITGITSNRQQRYAYSVGTNYRLAPGLDLVAEYTRHVVHEPGNLGLAQTQGSPANVLQDKLKTDVIIVGTRLAF